MQETWVLSLDQEDPLEKGVATHSSTFARFGDLHIQARAGGELCSQVPGVSEGPKPLLKEVGDEAPQGVAMPSSKGSHQNRDRTQVSCIAGGFLTI